MYQAFAKQMSKTTNDYIFVSDIKAKKDWFYGDFSNYELKLVEDEPVDHQDFLNIVDSRDRKRIIHEIHAIASGENKVHDMSYRWIKKDGGICWVHCRGQVVKDDHGNPEILFGSVSEAEMAHLYDQMTGLWNKEKFLIDLKEADLSQGYAMILFDIDNLTAINLTHGRLYGDDIIMRTARILEATPHIVSVYQIDQKNFVAVVDSCDHETLTDIFDQISKAQAGVCRYTAAALCLDERMSHDYEFIFDTIYLTLAKAKQHNKNHLEIYTEGDVGERIRFHTLYEELIDSTQHDFKGFTLVYQPKVCNKIYQLKGVEVLLRFESEKLGVIMPDEFISVLERSQLIDVVGMWLLEKAVCTFKQWQAYNLPMTVSVNFSTLQFKDPFLASKVMAIFKHYEVNPQYFCIEITESNPLHESHLYNRTLQALKEFGLGISIDDFGTGYSNIGYLKQLDITELKIDRFFVNDLVYDSYNYHLISNLVLFAQENNIEICCEGVECIEELGVLEGIEVSTMQGFLFDKPLDITTFEKTYLDQNSEYYKQRQHKIDQLIGEIELINPLHFNYKKILEQNKMGLWIARRTTCDELCIRGFAVDKELNQHLNYHEFYEYLMRLIVPEDISRVKQYIVDLAVNGGRKFVRFHIHHPTLGMLYVHCTGTNLKQGQRKTILCGSYIIMEE